jgi:hypothetical protein
VINDIILEVVVGRIYGSDSGIDFDRDLVIGVKG